MALNPIDETLASFDTLRGDWTLEMLAQRQAEDAKRKEETQKAAQAMEEPEATQIDAMAGWDEILPGVYKQVKDGQTSYTNVADASGAPSMNAIAGLGGAKVITPASVPNDSSVNTTDFNFQSRIAELESEKDPRAKLTKFFGLQEALAQEQARSMEVALQQAGAKLGLSEAEALLAQNVAADQSDPMWERFQTDSPQTKQQRAIVDSIRSRVNAEAATYLKTNTRLSGMNTKIDSMAKLLDYDLRQADRIAMQEDRQTETARLRQEQVAYRREQSKLELTPAMKARLVAIDPSLATRPAGPERDDAIADFYDLTKTNPDMKALILAPNETLMQEAVMSGNESAERIIAAEELERNPNTDMQTVRQQIARMRQLTKDDNTLAQILLQRAGNNREDAAYSQFVATASAMRSGATTKAQNESFAEQKYNLVRSLLQDEAAAKFTNDVASWSITDPALQAAVEAAKATTGKTNFEEVAAAFIGNTTGPARAAKADSLRQSLYKAADAKGRSLIANVNPDVVWNRWLVSKARMNISQRVSQAMNQNANMPFNSLADVSIPSVTSLAWRAAFAPQNFLADVMKDTTNEELNRQQ